MAAASAATASSTTSSTCGGSSGTGSGSSRSPRRASGHLDVPELYRRRVAALTDLLTDENTRPQAIEIIRSLIEGIEVGGIASVLALFVSNQENAAAQTGARTNQKGRPFRDELFRKYVKVGCGGRIWL
jgi:hypothetical protein